MAKLHPSSSGGSAMKKRLYRLYDAFLLAALLAG
jgi:hypothetical protein